MLETYRNGGVWNGGSLGAGVASNGVIGGKELAKKMLQNKADGSRDQEAGGKRVYLPSSYICESALRHGIRVDLQDLINSRNRDTV